MTTLILLGVGTLTFLGYAVYVRYAASAEPSVPKRVWVAVISAGAAIGAALATLYHVGVNP